MFGSYFKNKAHKKEVMEAAERKLREQALDKMILNQYVDTDVRSKAANPYDVDYKNPGRSLDNGKLTGGVMVSLQETNALSNRKYVLNPANIIRIGSGLSGNDIVVNGQGVAQRHCEIFSAGNQVYIRNCDPNYNTLVYRKKKRGYVDARGIKLLPKDILEIGDVTYEVIVFNA